MEEIKNIKKPKKKHFAISLLLSLAIISFLIGLWDIKSNAAESLNGIHFYIEIYNNNTVSEKYKRVVQGQDDMEVFYVQSHTENTNSEDTYALAYVVSKYPMTIYEYTVGVYESNMGQEYFDGSYPSVEYTINGQTFHIRQVGRYFTNTNNGGYNGYVDLSFDTSLPKKELTRWYDSDEFAQMYAENNLDLKVDYDNLPIDDNMPYPKNLKRNVMTFVDTSHFENPVNPSLGEFLTYSYDYITWENTTSEYKVQFQIMPIVQFYSQKLVGGKVFQDEKKGFWNTIDIFENDVVSYTKNTKPSIVYNEDEDSYNFYSDIVKNYDDVINGQPELFFGYRVRYIDDVNEKAGPWLTLLPTETNSHYVNSVEFSDSTVVGSDANGSNDVFNAEDTTVDDAKDSIDIENEYKDKYEVIDGNADTQQVVNWLNTVVSFIKGTPNIVTSVLSFLPQPILYGMYITIFLGCIASALAIIKALI